VRINPGADKQIIHVHRFPAEVEVKTSWSYQRRFALNCDFQPGQNGVVIQNNVVMNGANP
jgi:hypothetical protein